VEYKKEDPMHRRRSHLFNKAGLLVFGLLVAGSTVYALVLRTKPQAQQAIKEKAPTPAIVKARRPSTDLAAAVTPQPRKWGRLVKVEQEAARPVKKKLTTPMIHIAAGAEPVRQPRPVKKVKRVKVAVAEKPQAGPAGRLPPGGSGVMARFKAVPKPEENLPEAPDRVDIVRVMGTVRGKVQDCYDTGMVPGRVDLVLVVVGDSGRVKQAKVSADSSTATCIKRVARTLKFPRFSRDQVTIRYPYAFR
jgi:hypothetical protein